MYIDELNTTRITEHMEAYGSSGMFSVMVQFASDPDRLKKFNAKMEKSKFCAKEFEDNVLFPLFGSTSPFPLPENIPEDVKPEISEAIATLAIHPFDEWISTYGVASMILAFREFQTNTVKFDFFEKRMQRFTFAGREFKEQVLDKLFAGNCSFP